MGPYDYQAVSYTHLDVYKRQGSTGTKPLYLCHGDLDQHHMLMGDGYTAIIEYNRMHLGVQAMDLYRLMRKVMEKHSWNVDLGRSMLEAYERILCMTRKERRCLYYMFLYPEKYWKQINFYFNANKAWIPARNIEKLRSLEEQQLSLIHIWESRLRSSAA